MVRTEDAVIARYEHAGEKFEILVDPDLAMDLKHGKAINFDDLLAIDTIFKDAKKGDEKNIDAVRDVFHTTDTKLVAELIIKQGEIQLTTEQRRALTEKKRKEIIAFISRNAINPQTKAPHPEKRIEMALDELKFHVDLAKPTKDMINDVLKDLKRLLPISLEKLRIAVKIPATHSGRCSPILHKYGMQKEEWQNDGSIVAIIEIAAGAKQDLFNELNAVTHGDFESKMLDTKE